MRGACLEYQSWEIANGDVKWRWSYFSPEEMACRGTGELKVGVNFMHRLQAIRMAYRKPILIISGYRTPEHNLAITGKQSMSGAHTHGRAVDIALEGGEADVPLILSLAWMHGMTRCGLQLSRDRFKLHLDDMTADEGFAVRADGRGLLCWTY